MTVIRILVVEDFEPFRRLVRRHLERRPEFQIIGEVADGLEAVQKAKELQPDLVLMDIGLPTLNGIEAARRMREVAPHAKLLFVSLESSSSIVRETLRLGALGYVEKFRVNIDLLPAIDAVLGGRKFVSSSLEFSESTEAPPRHDVQFYSHDLVFVETATAFLATALNAGNPAIVLATRSHREELVERLRKTIDIDGAIQQGTYTAMDAAEIVSQIMLNGLPDCDRFFEGIRSAIEEAVRSVKATNPRVAILGECVGYLCAKGNMTAAIQLEKAGNDLIKTHNVDILCAYPLSAFQRKEEDQAFKTVCREHTSVFSR